MDRPLKARLSWRYACSRLVTRSEQLQAQRSGERELSGSSATARFEKSAASIIL